MAIDLELRSHSLGGSEIAAIIGLDSRCDAHDIYLAKTGMADPLPPNPRLRWGKLLEKVIAEAYSQDTGQQVEWWDRSEVHPERPWMAATVDAFVLENGIRAGIVDAKNVSFDQRHLWGEAGTESVPDRIGCQVQWYCSMYDLPWGDVAALFGGYDLRIYRLYRDRAIEAMLLEATEKFWRDLQAGRAPLIGATEGARAYIRKRFPRPVSNMRPATAEEIEWLHELRIVREKFRLAEQHKEALENRIRVAIGEFEGLEFDGEKVTFKRDKDSWGPAWEEIAHVLCDDEDRLEALAKEHQRLVREGARKLLVPRAWSKDGQ